MLRLLAPTLFVLIWSTGFIAARAVVPHADPQLFLSVRMAATAAVLGAAALVARDSWPSAKHVLSHLLVGALLPGFYLCASWWAVGRGMPAGVMSLLGALQPLPIALLSFALFGERLGMRSVAGIAIGALGVVLVLLPAIRSDAGQLEALPAMFGIAAVVAMASGTLIQHRLLSDDTLRVAVAVQNIGTAVGLIAYALVGRPQWDGSMIAWVAMAWSVLGLSIGGLMLLAWLVRRQDATQVSTLLLLVPALAAIAAWLLFGEALGIVQLVGFALALGGVLLARRATPTIEPG